MLMAALILILTTGLLFIYFQAVCQKLLRRWSAQEFDQSIELTPRATIGGRIHWIHWGRRTCLN